MNLEYFDSRLSNNAETIRSLVRGVTEEQARWKPTPDEWSILEVINHLYFQLQRTWKALVASRL